MKVFGDFDLSNFWSGGDYEQDKYIGASLKPELIESVERELGYKLPKSYIELMSIQNGGTPTTHAMRPLQKHLGRKITLQSLGFLRLIESQSTLYVEN